MPTISIVIPAYNAAKTILETIDSVRGQTFSDFELIIINDGSRDATLEILRQIKDDRIRIFSYENNGVCAARNRGIAQAKGDYIAFLDADDLWTPDKLEQQLNALQQNPEAGVAYSWTYFMYGSKQLSAPGKQVFHQGNVYSQLLVENFLAHGSNPLIKRAALESVGGFDPAFPHCADWDLYLRLAAKWEFVGVPKHQIYYRQSAGSMTSKIDGIEAQMTALFEKTFSAAPPQYQHLKTHSMAWLNEYCAQQYLEYGKTLADVEQAGKKLWRAVRLEPSVLTDRYLHNLLKWFIKRWFTIRLWRRQGA